MPFGDQDIIEALAKMVKENSEWAQRKISEITNKVFDREVVTTQPTEKGIEISVSGADESLEFQRSEFGDDTHHPAHRLLKWKEELDKEIK